MWLDESKGLLDKKRMTGMCSVRVVQREGRTEDGKRRSFGL
jgi:hypothetical protein